MIRGTRHYAQCQPPAGSAGDNCNDSSVRAERSVVHDRVINYRQVRDEHAFRRVRVGAAHTPRLRAVIYKIRDARTLKRARAEQRVAIKNYRKPTKNEARWEKITPAAFTHSAICSNSIHDSLPMAHVAPVRHQRPHRRYIDFLSICCSIVVANGIFRYDMEIARGSQFWSSGCCVI